MANWPTALLGSLLALSALCNRADAANCEADRQLYPENWKAVRNETLLFTCRGRYIRLKIFLTPRNKSTLMLTVVNGKNVYRAIMDPRDATRFKQQTGLYILYSESTCFIRGQLQQSCCLELQRWLHVKRVQFPLRCKFP